MLNAPPSNQSKRISPDRNSLDREVKDAMASAGAMKRASPEKGFDRNSSPSPENSNSSVSPLLRSSGTKVCSFFFSLPFLLRLFALTF
jgi:hypothetical protein